jgi:hypothetical protein
MDAMTSVTNLSEDPRILKYSPLYLVPDRVKHFRVPAAFVFGISTHLIISDVYRRNHLLGNILYTFINSAYASYVGHNFTITFILKP